MTWITGRTCFNCGKRIEPWRPKSTLYCDSSCRSENSRKLDAADPSRKARRPLRAARRRARSYRGDTVYAVFRVKGDSALPDLELVGFKKSRKRDRAIRAVADRLDLWRYGNGERGTRFVSIPMRDLVPYYASGEKASEVPGYRIAP